MINQLVYRQKIPTILLFNSLLTQFKRKHVDILFLKYVVCSIKYVVFSGFFSPL